MMRVTLSLSLSALLLSGCATVPFDTTSPTPKVAVSGLRGTLHGGQQPISGSTVSLFAVGNSDYGTGETLLASATTNAKGSFTIPAFTCPASSNDVPTYLLSRGGDAGGGTNKAIVLATAAGGCGGLANATVDINEVTTAATAYAMSHFFNTTLGSASTDGFGGASASGTYNQGLIYADEFTVPALVNIGQSDATKAALGNSSIISGTVTRETSRLYSIANILAACVNSTGPGSSYCTDLFADTRYPSGATAPTDTLQAAVQMALYPFNSVATLYNLPPAAGPFGNSVLTAQPNDWSLAIAYTYKLGGLQIQSTSNSQTSSNIDIDETGNIWFPTNASDLGGNGIGEFIPGQLSNGNPFGGISATYLADPQYVLISTGGSVFGNDMLNAQYGRVGAAATSTTGNTGPLAFYSDSAASYVGGGTASTPANYFYYGGGPSYAADGPFTYSAQALLSSSFGALSGANTPCIMGVPFGTNYVQTSASNCYAGGLAVVSSGNDYLMTTSVNQLCDLAPQRNGTSNGTCFTPPGPALSAPKGLEADGDEAIWIANSGNASISILNDIYVVGDPNNPFPPSSSTFVASSPIAYIHGSIMPAPYGLAIDRSGNVWVSNRGCLTNGNTTCTVSGITLSELIGAAAPTLTPVILANSSSTQSRPTANNVQAPASAKARPPIPFIAAE